MTTQFKVGQEYKINAVEFITVSRRTEVSVWFIQNGKEIRRKIQISGYGENSQEFVNLQDRSLYAIKTTVTPNEPCTTVETHQDIVETTPNEVPQDNQDELLKTYEVSTVEGLENDDNPDYNVYIVTAPNPSTALETIKARLMSQKTRFTVIDVSEAPTMIDDDWLEF
jgi:hypothetical protein